MLNDSVTIIHAATPSDSAAIMPRSRALGGQTALGLERAVCIEGKNNRSYAASIWLLSDACKSESRQVVDLEGTDVRRDVLPDCDSLPNADA